MVAVVTAISILTVQTPKKHEASLAVLHALTK